MPHDIPIITSLRHRYFRFLGASNLFFSLGIAIDMVVVPWLTYQQTNSPFLLGLATSVRWIPHLFLGLFVGVILDRFDKRKLLMLITVCRVLLPLPMAVLILTGSLQFWHIVGYNFFSGLFMLFTFSSYTLITRDLVGQDDLMNALSLNAAGMSTMGIIGSVLAGMIIEQIGPEVPFVITAASHLLALFSLRFIKAETTPVAATKESIWENLATGLRYVRSNRPVMALLSIQLLANAFGIPYFTLAPVFASDILNVGPSGLGYLMSAASVGGLIGTLSVAALGNFKNKGHLLFAIMITLGATLLLFSLSRYFTLSLIILVALGAADRTWWPLVSTLLINIVPADMRGRVMGTSMVMVSGMPIGSLQSGAVASIMGAPFAVGYSGIVLIIYGLFLILKVPSLRKI